MTWPLPTRRIQKRNGVPKAAVAPRMRQVLDMESGLGKEGTAPPLVGSDWVLAPGANRIAHIVLYGLTGPINVKGQEWNLTMLPWRETYSDEQIAAVLTYIRSQWGNKAGPVDPQVVKAARAEARPNYESSEELLKLPVQ